MHETSTIGFLFAYLWEKSYGVVIHLPFRDVMSRRWECTGHLWACSSFADHLLHLFIHLTASPWHCQYTIAAFLVLPSSSFPMHLSIPVILMNISSQCSREDIITIHRGFAMAIQSVADLGRRPRNLVLQPGTVTTALFLCSLLWAGHLFAGWRPPNKRHMVINLYSHSRPELDLNQHLRGAKASCTAHYWSLEPGMALVNGWLPTVKMSWRCQQSLEAGITKYSELFEFNYVFTW